MKSCGIGFSRIAAPAVLLGFVVSLFAIWFNEYIVPWSNTAYNNVVYYEIQKNTTPQSQEHIIVKDIEQGKIRRLVYARRYDAATETMASRFWLCYTERTRCAASCGSQQTENNRSC